MNKVDHYVINNFIIKQIKNSNNFDDLLSIYKLLKKNTMLINKSVINNFIKSTVKISNKNHYTKKDTDYIKNMFLKKLEKLETNQTGGSIFDMVGSIGKMALGSVKAIGTRALNVGTAAVKNQINNTLSKVKFVTDHIDCNKPQLLECLATTVPESAPLIAACTATGIETLGAGCAPALTELGGAATICLTKSCKPKLF